MFAQNVFGCDLGDSGFQSLLRDLFGDSSIICKHSPFSIRFSSSMAPQNVLDVAASIGLSIRQESEQFVVSRADLIKLRHALRTDPLTWIDRNCLGEEDPQNVRALYSFSCRAKAFTLALVGQDKFSEFLRINRENRKVSFEMYAPFLSIPRKVINTLASVDHGTRIVCSKGSEWLDPQSPMLFYPELPISMNRGTLDGSDGEGNDCAQNTTSFMSLCARYKRFMSNFSAELAQIQAAQKMALRDHYASLFEQSGAFKRENSWSVDSAAPPSIVSGDQGVFSGKEASKEGEKLDIDNVVSALEWVRSIVSNRSFVEYFTGDRMVSAAQVHLMRILINVNAEIDFLRDTGNHLNKETFTQLFSSVNEEIGKLLLVYSWYSALTGSFVPQNPIFNVTSSEVAELRDFLCALKAQCSDVLVPAQLMRNALFVFCGGASGEDWGQLASKLSDDIDEEAFLGMLVERTSFSEIRVSRKLSIIKVLHAIVNNIPIISSVFASFIAPRKYRVSSENGDKGVFINDKVRHAIDLLGIDDRCFSFDSSGLSSDKSRFKHRVDAYRKELNAVGGAESITIHLRRYKVVWYSFCALVIVVFGVASVLERVSFAMGGALPYALLRGLRVLRGLVDSLILIVGLDTVLDFFIYKIVFFIVTVVSLLDRILLGGLISGFVRMAISLVCGVVDLFCKAVYESAVSIAEYGLKDSLLIFAEAAFNFFASGRFLIASKEALVAWVRCVPLVDRVISACAKDHCANTDASSRITGILSVIPVISFFLFLANIALRIQKAILYKNQIFNPASFVNGPHESKIVAPGEGHESQSTPLISSFKEPITGSISVSAAVVENPREIHAVIKKRVDIVRESLDVIASQKVISLFDQSQRLFTINRAPHLLRLLSKLYVQCLLYMDKRPDQFNDADVKKLDACFTPVLTQLCCLLRYVSSTFTEVIPIPLVSSFANVYGVEVSLGKPTELIDEVGNHFLARMGCRNILGRLSHELEHFVEDWFSLKGLISALVFYFSIGYVLDRPDLIDAFGEVPEVIEDLVMDLGLGQVSENLLEMDLARIVFHSLWPKIGVPRDILSIGQGSLQIMSSESVETIFTPKAFIDGLELRFRDGVPNALSCADFGLEDTRDSGAALADGQFVFINTFVYVLGALTMCNSVQRRLTGEDSTPSIVLKPSFVSQGMECARAFNV